MTILGIDPGNHSVKTVGEEGTDIFTSLLGQPHEQRIANSGLKDYMHVKFGGKEYFAGKLAEEQAQMKGSKRGITKANDHVLIRVLLACYRYKEKETDFDIVVGQPIETHTPTEKQKIIKMLKGEHQITVNGLTRLINIQNVQVAAEGASVGILAPIQGKYHILDVGSGTVNWATVGYDGERVRFFDKDSGTEGKGLSTIRDVSIESVVDHLVTELGDLWDKRNVVRIVGEAADLFLVPFKAHFPKAEVFKPTINSNSLAPVYGNAAAFYTIARSIYGKKN